MVRRRLVALLVALLVCALGAALVGCGAGHGGAPPEETATAPVPRAAPFVFHSGDWVNLHLVLYGQALKRNGQLEGGGGGNGLGVLTSIDTVTLSPDEQVAWDRAVAFYATTYAKRDPTFDDELADIETKLSARAGSAHLDGAAIPPALSAVLEGAMPVYRAHWWADDDRTNQRWIAEARARLDRYGPQLPAELARFYQTKWPREPLPVDVTRFASWGGAYSTLGPAHITLSAADPRNGLPAGLESLLHEASHTMIRPVRDALTKELAAQHKEAKGLWHALLFFTAGFVVEERVPGYVPYAYKYGLYAQAWPTYLPPLEQHWKPYLQGRTSFAVAIRDVVTAL